MEEELSTGEQGLSREAIARANQLAALRPYQYKKGQSGNPAGRAKGISLKEYAKNKLASMTEEEREDFMEGIDKQTIWEMAESKASQGIGQADDLEKFSVSL